MDLDNAIVASMKPSELERANRQIEHGLGNAMKFILRLTLILLLNSKLFCNKFKVRILSRNFTTMKSDLPFKMEL